MKSKNVNWSSYYAKIHSVCPYSGFSYSEGKTLHTPFKHWDNVIQNEAMLTPMKLWAVLYTDCPYEADELDEWAETRNQEQTVIQYYFSHPDHNPLGWATPVPVLIQQRRDILDMARKGVFDGGMDSRTNPDSMVKKYETTGKTAGGSRGRPGVPRKQETKDKISQSHRRRNGE